MWRGERASVEVDDEGPGIPEALQQRVFDPFFRTEGSRNRETGTKAACALLFHCPCRVNNFRIAEIFSHGQGSSPMFVSDSGRLPDSGRICVVGSTGATAGKTFYSVSINAARAEIEPMDEPRNLAHVLGVGSEVRSAKGPVFAAYFAATRDRYDATPNYKEGLFVLVDGAVYAVRQEKVSTTIRRGLGARTFTLLRGDRPQRSVVYPWPWYQPFSNANDFLQQLSGMVRTFGQGGGK